MIIECGYWDIESEVQKRFGHRYFVAKHRCNPTKVELVFLKANGLEGKKELVEFIKKEKLIT